MATANRFEQLTTALGTGHGHRAVAGLRRGIEKESLRVTPDGYLATTHHPRGLGSALTHPHITTDFSESQLELITSVFDDVEGCLGQLERVHGYVYRKLGDEVMWSASMPCMVEDDASVPLGQFGTSNVGTAKTVYRRGLGHRYGRLMQTISGIHYNFSMPAHFWTWMGEQLDWQDGAQEHITAAYFGLIRNFRRTSWLLFYLFGASPAVCKSFLKHSEHELAEFDEGSVYAPWATSLRMGGLGYQSDAQATLNVSYNSLGDYAEALRDALTRSWPPYEQFGLKVDGEYQQLSTHLLQIENEFYGTIRPKRTIHPGERALHALSDRGVEYVEVRCMDVNPFLPLGIDAETCRFLDVFLVQCLLTDSPPDTLAEIEAMTRNRSHAVEEGRRPDLQLEDGERLRSIPEWGHDILERCETVARVLDAADGDGDAHLQAVQAQRVKLDDPEATPSARILAAMSERGVPFFRFALNASLAHAEQLRQAPLDAATLADMEAESAASLAEQARIEATDDIDFDTYRERYINQDLLPSRGA